MLRHKLKIILIRLEDDEMDVTLNQAASTDQTLKVILDGVVHFRYPQGSAESKGDEKRLAKFWERVSVLDVVCFRKAAG
jgi:hypothetical protein